MKSITIIALFLISSTVTVHAWWETVVDTVEVSYPDGQLKEQYQTVFFGGNEKTSKYGFYRAWHENGEMEWEGHYARDSKVGTWINWDSTGRCVVEVTYLNGAKHGTEIEWNSDGTVRTMIHYRNGVRHGLCTWNVPEYSINTLYNNPPLAMSHESFYLNGELIVETQKENSTAYNFNCADPRTPYYNSELDLWIEGTRDACNFFVGRKVDGKKNGMWVLWTKTGDMKKAEYYDMGVALKSE